MVSHSSKEETIVFALVMMDPSQQVMPICWMFSFELTPLWQLVFQLVAVLPSSSATVRNKVPMMERISQWALASQLSASLCSYRYFPFLMPAMFGWKPSMLQLPDRRFWTEPVLPGLYWSSIRRCWTHHSLIPLVLKPFTPRVHMWPTLHGHCLFALTLRDEFGCATRMMAVFRLAMWISSAWSSQRKGFSVARPGGWKVWKSENGESRGIYETGAVHGFTIFHS